MGRPDPERICTSIVERSNLSDPHGSPSLYTTYERLLEEVGEPLGSGRMLVHVLQLLPGSQVSSGYACDGGGNRQITSGAYASYWRLRDGLYAVAKTPLGMSTSSISSTSGLATSSMKT